MATPAACPPRSLRWNLNAELERRREELERLCGCGVWWVFWRDRAFILRKAFTLRRVATFGLTSFPHCSPLAIFNGEVIHPDFRGRGVAKLLHEVRLEAARLAGVQCLLATVTVDNHPQNAIMRRYAWTVDTVFQNPTSGNTVQLYRRQFTTASDGSSER